MNDLNKALENFSVAISNAIDEFRMLSPKIAEAMVECIDRYDEWYDNYVDKTEARLNEWLNARYVEKNLSPTEKGK